MKNIFKLFFFILIFVFIFRLEVKNVHAISDPLKTENNVFGIHIHDENDLTDAAKLVNSSGGDWGYVTIVIRSDERDKNRWQNAMDRMRELHIIPIVRIATNQEGAGWIKPSVDDIDGWVNFLDSLNWVIKNRYVVIGNEPNHASEWGGVVDPEGYALFLKEFSIQLKRKNEDFFVLPAGLDASSPNSKTHMSEQNFIKNMISKVPDIFEHVDGWTSHSYPNPDFSAHPDKTGSISINSYKTEIELLRSLGVNKSLPVFITETGWVHETDRDKDKLSIETVKNYYASAFDKWTKDTTIAAITPFILNYQEPPFDVFSFKKPDGSYYEFYSEIQKILKKQGAPERINTALVISDLTPEIIKKENNAFSLSILKNTGQIIWEMDTLYTVRIEGYDINAEIGYPLFSRIDPGHIGILMYRKL